LEEKGGNMGSTYKTRRGRKGSRGEGTSFECRGNLFPIKFETSREMSHHREGNGGQVLSHKTKSYGDIHKPVQNHNQRG